MKAPQSSLIKIYTFNVKISQIRNAEQYDLPGSLNNLSVADNIEINKAATSLLSDNLYTERMKVGKLMFKGADYLTKITFQYDSVAQR